MIRECRRRSSTRPGERAIPEAGLGVKAEYLDAACDEMHSRSLGKNAKIETREH